MCILAALRWCHFQHKDDLVFMHTIPYSTQNLRDEDAKMKQNSHKRELHDEELKVWIFLLLFAFIKICVLAAVVCRNYFIYGMEF